MATTQGSLNVHWQSKHDGVRYKCDECDHLASTQATLRIHRQSKHSGTKYECEQCDFKTGTSSYLRVIVNLAAATCAQHR